MSAIRCPVGEVRRRPRGLVRRSLPLLSVILWAGCGGDDDQRTGSVTRDAIERARAALDPAVVAQLDSGNAATRAGRHDVAVGHYRRAAEIDETAAAAWFGIYMSERALGNEEEATRALERARQVAPRASLIEEPPPEVVGPPP